MKRRHWVKPQMVCQIKFTEWTPDDRLRPPVFLGITEDNNPNEVVREKTSYRLVRLEVAGERAISVAAFAVWGLTTFHE